jgi:hypothetical protein
VDGNPQGISYYSGHKESNNLQRDIVILRVLRGAELASQSASERNIQPAWQSLKLLTRRYLNSGQGNTSQTIAEKRVKQALDTHAEVLVTACPFCKITLTDAVKALKVEGSIQVMDITKLIVMAL